MGKIGFSIIVCRRPGQDSVLFLLQYRCVDQIDEPSLAEGLRISSAKLPKSIRLAQQMGIRRCPQCGTDLNQWAVLNSKRPILPA